MYRVCIKFGSNWKIGRIEYEDLREAGIRAEYFRSMGKQVKVISNKDLGLRN